jgi:hypothetical protein
MIDVLKIKICLLKFQYKSYKQRTIIKYERNTKNLEKN